MMMEEAQEKRLFRGVPRLVRGLNWLLGTCALALLLVLSVPFAPNLGMFWLLAFFIGIAISSYHLAQGASSRWEATKILAIPSSFFLLAVYGVWSDEQDFAQIGMQGLMLIAPVWLSEILRYKARQHGLKKSARFYLFQHGLSHFLVLSLWFRWDVATFLTAIPWCLSFPIGFAIIKNELTQYGLDNQRRILDEEPILEI